ncbi:DUF4397 domain-containing protein [Gemmatimonas sp.]|uniref:DUF4397 domain-containing protein n=2 Tax=Gemmatimonas sp. TaxID=1962908 RepID=UPI0022BFE963|nr:DUF4397 domain-containing protein [Gemmatimonas sp.]MCZ8011900.1 DUF4397 domain-containing protein [Gemmatimonas sp.]MCZ8265551.1 DUF4397 domain-containing protein [Gemmatimonas sp.]
MRFRHLSSLIAAAAALSACSTDEVSGVATQLAPAASVRYVNAVGDTSALDFRFVDGEVEGSPQFAGMTFRQFTPYQRARAGTRRMRVFTNPAAFGNSIDVARQQHIDTTFNFEAGKRYTIMSFGFSRAGSTPRHRLVITEDVLPTTLAATAVGVRTIHAAAGVGNVDVWVQPSEAAAGVTGAPTASNVAPLAATAYLTLAARPVGSLLYRWDVAPTGTTTPVTMSPSSGLPGQVGTAAQNPLVGFQVGRSIITAIVFAPSVVGSRAPQGGEFANVGMRFLPDRHLDTTEQ